MTRRRHGLIGTTALVGAVATGAALALPAEGGTQRPASAAGGGDHVVRQLDRAAHDLNDEGRDGGTAELARAAADAEVVGLGEATHSSREFFTTKKRVFQYLVEHAGFRTFALEGSWSTGLLLNDYVLHGTGDPKQIMQREYQYNYRFWNTQEYADLLEWMREYNASHPDPDDKIRFMGNDLGFTGNELYDRITGHVAEQLPDRLGEFERLYRDLRPEPGTSTKEFSEEWLGRPKQVRVQRAKSARRALDLLKKHGRDGDADRAGGSADRKHTWAVQHARAVWQTAHAFSLDLDDPEEFARQMRFRDESMAANTVWWNEHVGDKIVLSSHNSHVGYVAEEPELFPKPVGLVLRERIGDGFLSVGTTFDKGSFNARDKDFTGPVRRFSVPPGKPGTAEHTLERVRYDDYVLDLRNAPPKARSWLKQEHPLVNNIGLTYPVETHEVSLADSYDVLIHFSEVRAAELLP